MNISKFLVLAVAAGAMFTSCEQTAEKKQTVEQTQEVETNNKAQSEQQTDNAIGEVQKATFAIEGMTCAVGCANFIQKKLTEVPGVQQAVVDYDTKTATVVFDGNQQNIDHITGTVEKIANGIYKVNEIQVEQVSL